MQIKAFLPANRPRFSESTAEPARAGNGPDIRNTDAVLALLDYRALEICGRAYRVPPISGRDGVLLIDLMQRFTRVATGGVEMDVPAYGNVLAEIRRIAKRLLMPLGWRARLLWRLHIRRDPLRDATEQETGMVLGFLFACRTSGHVRFNRKRAHKAARNRETSRMN